MRAAVRVAVLTLAGTILAACGGGYALPSQPRFPTRIEDLPPQPPATPSVEPLTTVDDPDPYAGDVLPPAPTPGWMMAISPSTNWTAKATVDTEPTRSNWCPRAS